MRHLFSQAQPVWVAGPRQLPYDIVGFRAVLDIPADPSSVKLNIAASSVYRAWVNGEHVSFGPARTAKGFFRVDTVDLSPHVKPGPNLIAIEVVHYGANSFVVPDQDGFICAEVSVGDKVLAATHAEKSDFSACEVAGRLRKVARYSFQRAFSEAYRLSPSFAEWRSNVHATPASLKLETAHPGQFIPKQTHPLSFVKVRATALVAQGKIVPRTGEISFRRDRSLTEIGPQMRGYPESELEVNPTVDYQRFTRQVLVCDDLLQPGELISIPSGHLRIIDLGVNRTGFVAFNVTCKGPTKLWMAFDEIRDAEGGIDALRLGCVNVIQIELEPGTYAWEGAEPSTMRFLEFTAVEGAVEISDVALRECVNPCSEVATFACDDPRLNQIFHSAIETFKQNAVDIFMDCPSRERAGWLCDSFFTSRTESMFTGESRVEHDFLENFALPDRFEHLPEGMLAMCYPADHLDGVYIPQWSLWFVLQCQEHMERTGDQAFAQQIRPRIEKLLGWFKHYENSDGLLEKLPSWNFIEWSDANQWTQDVNYPTNMLYSGVLRATARMFSRDDLAVQAAKILDTIHHQSYDGEFFVDNAVRKDGKLILTRNRSEVCQYYAFFFGVGTPEKLPELWRKLTHEFGPLRQEQKRYPEVAAANAFIGNVLRMDLLSKAGLSKQVREELVGYFYKMAVLTGTLWENDQTSASCNHGFASYVGTWLLRDALGIRSIDHRAKTVEFSQTGLVWANGRIPTPDGFIDLAWEKGQPLRWTVPSGYSVKVLS